MGSRSRGGATRGQIEITDILVSWAVFWAIASAALFFGMNLAVEHVLLDLMLGHLLIAAGLGLAITGVAYLATEAIRTVLAIGRLFR